MAAIDLRAAPIPTVYTFTAATTWQEIQLPPRCRATVSVESANGYLGFEKNGTVSSPEEPTDGGAVGTHRVKFSQDTLVTFRVAPITDYRNGQSIFVAAASGTPTASVVLEALES